VRIGRVLLVGLPLLALANLWVRQGELMSLATQVAIAVPPAPAFATLVLLLPVAVYVRRLGLGRKELLAVYCFLTLSVALTSSAAMRYFLAALPTPFYFASAENRFEQFHQYIPEWIAPRGSELIRQAFEGSETGTVPWAQWAGPLSLWLLFFAGLFGLLICLSLVFRPVWEREEHLAYPLSELALVIAGERRDRIGGLWRNAAFWTGIGLVVLFNVFAILNAFNPAIPAIGRNTDLNGLFTEHPLIALRPMAFDNSPIVLGLAYMMPTDIVLSTLVFYFLYFKGLSLAGALAGFNEYGFPFWKEQGGGAFLGMAILVFWGARHRFAEVFRRLKPGSGQSRALPLALLASLAVVFMFCRAAGMATPLILGFFGLFFAFSVAYMRGRAETGYPSLWVKPLGQERTMMVNLVGTRRLEAVGGFSSLTILTMLHFLSRGYMGLLAAYVPESFKISDEVNISVRQMAWLMLAAVVFGSVASWAMHLDAYYEMGANVLAGGTTSGGARVTQMRSAYEGLAALMRGHIEPNPTHTAATAVGLIGILVVFALRRLFLRFPLHPLGFMFAFSGVAINGWGMLGLATIVKSSVLRIGGRGLYNRLLPFFIGLIVGHYFAAGLLWSLISTFFMEGFQQYPVWF